MATRTRTYNEAALAQYGDTYMGRRLQRKSSLAKEAFEIETLRNVDVRHLDTAQAQRVYKDVLEVMAEKQNADYDECWEDEDE